jgi:hypothetical protein
MNTLLYASRGVARRALAAVILLACACASPAAFAQQGLKYFKNYFVTGDYVAAGVGLQHTGVNGLANGTITIDPAQIPQGAEVVAAYLYWQTISSSGTPDPSTLQGAKFKGNDISKVAVLLNPGGGAPCWSSGGATGSSNGSKATWSYRADVMPYFPRIRQAGPSPSVQVDVTGPHQVTLPDMGNSNQLPSTLGAGLVIVYRVVGYDQATGYATPLAPLRSIVLFDGGFTLNNQNKLLQVTLEGFYEASRSAPNARMTQLVADGQANKTERLQITSTASAADNKLVAISPFNSGTGYDVVTFPSNAYPNPLPLEAGAMKATVSVDPGTTGTFDCLSWSAMVLSTVVQDADGDGLLDVWESQAQWASKPSRLASVYPSWPLTDPTGVALPNLQAMGANPAVQDVFVQIDYLYGSDGHTHLPAKSALQSVASALHGAGPRPVLVAQGSCAANAAAGACPINVHFDVGANYQPAAGFNAANCANAWTTDCAIVPASVAMGGNPIPEVLCQSNGTLATDGTTPCAFPNYPGVVGWKNGFRAYRDQPIQRSNGSMPCAAVGQAGCDLRLPRNRKDMFHYSLFAHALGIASSTHPGAPRNTSGIADGGGGDLMVTLGLWDGETGTPFIQGSTLMHELGHNLGLRHGGVLQNGAVIEANCKPNYQSIMNYLFQIQGLLTLKGVPTIDYSRQQLLSLSESALSEATGLGQTSYLARWYAPGGYLGSGLNVTPATRHCDGSALLIGDKPMVIVDADPRQGTALDWNADGVIAGSDNQDVNFDGISGESFTGANDYATMDLRQVGSRRAIGSQTLSYSVIDPSLGYAPAPPLPPVGGGLSLDTGYGDLGYGDLGYGDLGYGDLGYGDLGYGDLGYGDLGYGDLGYGDLGAPGPEDNGSQGPGDLNLDTAAAVGSAPSALTATVLKKSGIALAWQGPNVGTPIAYQVYRVQGSSVTPATFAQRVLIANVTGTTTSVTDNLNLKNNVTYTYFVVATVAPPAGCAPNCGNQQSGVSNFATVTF